MLLWSCLIRTATTAAAALVLAVDGPNVAVYALAVLATAAFTVFGPAHSALLPAFCQTPLELTSANVEPRPVRSRQVVFRQGDRGDRYYVIVDGEAKVIGDGRLIAGWAARGLRGNRAAAHDGADHQICARTSLRLRTLDRRHFMSALSGYQSSAREADTLIRDRLATFDPRAGHHHPR